MAQANKDPSAVVDIATWELVCFCLYNDNEKRELLGNPRLPMRIIDEIFLFRAILGKLFLTSQDCKDLQHRLRTSGFSDDLTTLKVLPPTRHNIQEAHERAQRTVKNSYNHDEKGINKEWYKTHSFSIEVLMLMTQNSMQDRLKRKGMYTPELDSPEKKRKLNEEVVLPGSVTPISHTTLCSPARLFTNDTPTGMVQRKGENLRDGSGFVTMDFAAAASTSVPMSQEWESFPPLHIDLTADAVPPITIDITQSNDEEDDDGKEWEEQKPPAVHNPSWKSSQWEEEEEVRVVTAQPVNPMTAALASSSTQPIQPISDQTPLVNNDCPLVSQDPEEESSMVIPTENTSAMVHYVKNGYRSKMHLPSVVITLAVWLIGFHVLLWSVLGLDQARFLGEPYKPLRICFSIEAMSRPRIYPLATMDQATSSDPNYGPWLERDEMLPGMMMMMTNTSMYLHRQCYPWYGAVTTTLGVLATLWILSKLHYRVKSLNRTTA